MASCHGKESSLSLPFSRVLGLDVQVCRQIDTDTLGTFCGEVERPGPPHQVVVSKARLALTHHGDDLAVASEATFGPHPSCPWVPIHREVLVVVDGANDRVWTEEDVAYKTNHRQETLASADGLRDFASRVGVPSHRMMLKTASGWIKGVGAEWVDLALEFPLQAASDMRAHCNPTRRRLIRRLGIAMSRRLRRLCPGCGEPGFGRVDFRRGLPCSLCGLRSEWVEAEIWGCQGCSYRKDMPRPDGRSSLDPVNCPHCNP